MQSPYGFDFTGLTFFVTAVGVLVTTVTTAGLAIASFVQTGRLERNLTEVKRNTDGMKEQLVAAISSASKAEGVKEGVTQERANPMVPASGKEKPDA